MNDIVRVMDGSDTGGVMKVSELSGALLALWVARAQGLHDPVADEESGCWYYPKPGAYPVKFAPHEDWAQGGPIIDREKLEIVPRHDMRNRFVHWSSQPQGMGHLTMEDTSPLVAAMRAFVASKFGDEVSQEAQ